jgi:hypothetical protein
LRLDLVQQPVRLVEAPAQGIGAGDLGLKLEAQIALRAGHGSAKSLLAFGGIGEIPELDDASGLHGAEPAK